MKHVTHVRTFGGTLLQVGVCQLTKVRNAPGQWHATVQRTGKQIAQGNIRTCIRAALAFRQMV